MSVPRERRPGAGARKPARVPLFGGAKVHEHRLRNGLTVLIAERHLDPVVAVMLWYRVGSRDERPEEAGVSHFLEHMMFKGTKRFGKGEIDRTTTVLGGSNNAFTSTDHTAYWFELASDRWEAALEIEADRMHGLLLDPGEFTSEKAVVLEELAMGLDDPWRSLTEKVQEVLFGRHPYARPIIGYADVLERMTPEIMRDYYTRHYHTGNAVLVVAGDVTPARALRSVRATLGALPGARNGAPRAPREPSPPGGEWRLETRWDDPGARIAMAWPTVPVTTDADYALDLASALLTTGRRSRLFEKLVLEQEVAVHVGASNDTRVDGGAFWLYAEGVQGTAPGELEAAIDVELAALAAKPVRKAELDRAKAILSAAEAYESETATDLAEGLGEYAADARWQDALQVNARRAAVQPRDVRDAVVRYLARGRRVVGWSLPEDGR